MLTKEPTVQSGPRRLDPNERRWWFVTGLTGLSSVAIGAFIALVLAFGVVPEGDLLSYVVAGAPLAVAGLVTGLVGGVRRWWLSVPTLVAPLVCIAVVLGEGEVYPSLAGPAYNLLVIGVPVVVTVVASWLIRRFTG